MGSRLYKKRSCSAGYIRSRLRRIRLRNMRQQKLDHRHATICRVAQDGRWWRRYLTSLPDDARAIIEPYPSASNHGRGGRAHKNEWRLRFEPRKRPFVDWLTGWTGGEDPLLQIDLRFDSRDAAVRYCERIDLPYEVHEPPRERAAPLNKQRFQFDDAPIRGWPGDASGQKGS
ncbi:NADH dehydrogenase ubiquinone Fe-S protein 4 [Sphingomonas melonis]